MRRRRVKRRRKIKGKGIQRPYVSKRNRLMLGKGKKQKGGFIAPIVAAAVPAQKKMPPRNNIVMIKRENPKRVVLPNGRVFYAKYKRVDRDALPPNIQIMRRYKQRAAPKGKRRRRPA